MSDREPGGGTPVTGRAGAGHHGEPTAPEKRPVRFPGFDVMSQSGHWDATTRAVIQDRLAELPPIRFFSRAEEAAAHGLVGRILDLHDEPGAPPPDIVRMIDGRLAEKQTDGWHYDTMPQDGEAWRASLEGLDQDAVEAGHEDFASASEDDQNRMLSRVQATTGEWHGMQAAQVWRLWTRYAATAFYSHPESWNEIGFPGPAYPRGYKNLGVDAREPFEVADAYPNDDPQRKTR